jgi:hypothetical protein
MLTALFAYLRQSGHKGPDINHILSLLCANYGSKFCTFADCGAAIGHTAVAYKNIQALHLASFVISHFLRI